MHFGLLAIFAIFTISCEREKLSEVLVNENKPNVSIGMESKIEVAGGDNFTLDNNQLTVPIKIDFTGASGKAFTVNVVANTDTIANLIANGTLPPGTVALEQGTYNFPAVVNVDYGVKSVTWDLRISRTFLERNYGKDVAMVVKMTDAAKGNTIASNKNTTIIVVKTGLTIAPEDVHYVTFGEEDVVSIPRSPIQSGYSLGSQDMLVDVNLALSGEAGPSFTVDAAKSAEIVTEAIANGTLTNVIPLAATEWSIPNPRVTFEEGKNAAVVGLSLKINSIVFHTGKKIAIGLTLKNPTKYQLGTPAESSQIVLIDPDHFRKPFNGTPFLIKGTIGVASDFIRASHYDLGGPRVAYFDNGGRDGGQFRRPDEVDIAPDDIKIGWTANDEWVSYSVVVEADGEYEVNTLIGSSNANGKYSIFFGYDNLTGILPTRNTGNYDTTDPHLATVVLKKGKHVMRFYENVGSYDFRGFTFTRKK